MKTKDKIFQKTGIKTNNECDTVVTNPIKNKNMIQNIEYIDMDRIIIHPEIEKVYKEKNLKLIKLTIQLKGILEPLKGTRKDGLILIWEGVSRFIAARELGHKKIPVMIVEMDDKSVMEEYVLRNVRTKRAFTELMTHAEIVLDILGLSQGKKREVIGSLDLGDDDFCKVGKDRFEIACEIIGANISPTSLRRLMLVKEFDDNGSDEVKSFKLKERLDNGDLKINQAYNIMKTYQNTKDEQGTNEVKETLAKVEGQNFQLFNKTCSDLSDIPDNSIDLAQHSGPYFQQRNYKLNDYDPQNVEHGQERTPDEFIDAEIKIYNQVYGKLKDTGSLFVNIADSYNENGDCLIPERLIIKMVENGWYVNQKWHWVKDNQKPQNCEKRLMPNHEYLIHFVKNPKTFYFREFKNWLDGDIKLSIVNKSNKKDKEKKKIGWTLVKPLERFRTFLDTQHVANVIEASGFRLDELQEIDPNFRHIAPYPSYIPLLPILMTTKVGDTVLDIFNGTGTTTAVALQLGRKAIGYDLDPKNHEFAGKRLSMVEDNLPTTNEINDLESKYFDTDSNQKLVA